MTATPYFLSSSAALATSSWPATSAWTWPPSFCAACLAKVIAGRVVFRSPFLSSATTSTFFIDRFSSDDLCFFVQLLHEGRHVGDDLAGLARRRFGHLQRLDLRSGVHAELGERRLFQGLLLRLHDAGQRSVAGLVQAEICGDDAGQRHVHRLEASVHFANDAHALAVV